MGCVFSEKLRVQLDRQQGAPPGVVPVRGTGGARTSYASRQQTHWQAVATVLRSPARLAHTAVDDLLITFFPGECRLCGDPLPHARSTPICTQCTVGLEARAQSGCRRCGDSLDLSNNFEDVRFQGMLCAPCRLVPPAFSRAVSFGDYTDELRELIHFFKYDRMHGLAGPLGARLAEAILTLRPLTGSTLTVIAVPLASRTERHRGFNQATLLATHALGNLRRVDPDWKLVPAHGALVRGRSTDPQFSLSWRDRRRNLAGAFTVKGDLAGKEVLLIDDIMTTGATARECSRVLIEAGAAKVWVATLARALKEAEAEEQEELNGEVDLGLPEHFGATAGVARWDSAGPLSIETHTHTGDH